MRKQISITLDCELLEKVRELAESDRRNVSQMIGVLLEEALEKRKEND